jgi:hypothetical protein
MKVGEKEVGETDEDQKGNRENDLISVIVPSFNSGLGSMD